MNETQIPNQELSKQENNIELLRLKAGILNQSSQPTPSIANAELELVARRRPHSTSLRRAVEGKIANTLIKLRGSGLAESTLKYTLWLLS